MALAGWQASKKIKFAPGSALVPSSLTNISLPMALNTSAGITDYDLSRIFTDLDPIDPYWSSVALALPCDGANGSNTFTDVSPTPKTVTANGNAQISTAQFKAGGASGFFDGSGDFLSTPDHADFALGTNPFCIEAWVRPTDFSHVTVPCIIAQRGSYTSQHAFTINFAVSGTYLQAFFSSNGGSTGVAVGVSYSFDTNNWYHIAVCRVGNNLLTFVNGQLVDTTPFNITVYNATSALKIGAFDTTTYAQSYFKGYIDNLRITKGNGRYTENFTPPSRSIETYSPSCSGLNPLAKKIAIEIGETGVEVPIGIVPADWDYSDNTAKSAKIYPTFSSLADGDEFWLYYDSAHADNVNVSELGSPPAAPPGGDALTVWNLAVADALWEYSTVGATIRAILAQPYSLTIRLAALLDQIYGLRLLAALVQYYGDAPTLRALLDQRYGDAAKLRRTLEQLYGNSPKYRAALDQLYNLHAGLRAAIDQNYAIAEGQVKAAIDQIYNLQDKDQLRAALDMLYVLAAGEALVQRNEITITCDGMEHTSAYNINIEQDRGQYFMAGELQLADQVEYLQYRRYASEVEITVDGQTYRLMPEIPREARQPGVTIYVVPLVSRTKLLDSPHSRLSAGELTGMASALVATLAAPFTVDWQLVDWFIPAGRLAVNEGDPAINVIRRIVEAVGGVLQTDPDGVLVCAPEYPVSVNKWETVEPAFHLTDQDDFFQIDPATESRYGYNVFQISDQQLSAAGLTMETTTIGPWESEIRVYQVPWDDETKINLLHSGDPERVTVVADGVTIETIASERVEIVGGAGRTVKPIFSLDSYDYNETDLGQVTVAEDGTVTTATTGNSLLYLTYRTRCWLFTVLDYTAEDVQFFPEETAA